MMRRRVLALFVALSMILPISAMAQVVQLPISDSDEAMEGVDIAENVIGGVEVAVTDGEAIEDGPEDPGDLAGTGNFANEDYESVVIEENEDREEEKELVEEEQEEEEVKKQEKEQEQEQQEQEQQEEQEQQQEEKEEVQFELSDDSGQVLFAQAITSIEDSVIRVEVDEFMNMVVYRNDGTPDAPIWIPVTQRITKMDSDGATAPGVEGAWADELPWSSSTGTIANANGGNIPNFLEGSAKILSAKTGYVTTGAPDRIVPHGTTTPATVGTDAGEELLGDDFVVVGDTVLETDVKTYFSDGATGKRLTVNGYDDSINLTRTVVLETGAIPGAIAVSSYYTYDGAGSLEVTKFVDNNFKIEAEEMEKLYALSDGSNTVDGSNAIDTRRAGGLWSWQGGNGPSQGEAIMPVLDSMGTSGITQISSGGVPSNFMSRNNWSWTTSAGIAYNYFWGSEIGIGIGSLMPYHIYGLELPVRGSGLAGNHNIGYTWVGWPGKTLESGVGTYIGTSLIAVVDGDMGSGVNAYARTMDNVDITPFIDRGEFVSRTDTNSATPWSFVVDGMDYAEPRYEYEYSDMDYRGVPADLLVLPNGNELADWARKPAWETWGYGDTLEPRALFYLVPILARLGYGSVTYDAGWYDRGGTTPAGSDPIYMPRWDGSTSTSANCNWDLVAPLLEAYFAQHPHPKHTTPGDAYDFTNLDRTTQSGAIRIVRAMNEYVHDHGMHVLAWIQTTYVAAGPYGAGVVPAEWAVLNPNGSRNGNYGCCGNPDFINVATTYISEIIFGDGKGEYAFDGFKGDSIGGIPPCYATGHGHDGDPYAPMRNYGLFYKNLLDKAAYIRGATEYVGGPIVNANQMPAMKHCMCGRRMDYYSFTGVNRPIWGDHGGTKQNRQGNRIWRGFFGWDVPMDSDHHELDSRDDGTRAVLESIGDFDYATALGTGMLFTGKTRINLNEYNDKVEERSSLMTFPGSENYNKRTGFLEAIDDDYDGPSPWGDGAIKWGRAVKYYGLYHDIKVVQSRMFDNLYKYAVDYPEAYAFELMDRNPITGVLTPKASSERVYSFYATSFPIDATDPRVRNDPPAGSGFDAASGSKYYREVANSGSNPRTWDPWNSIDKGIPNTTAWIEPNIPFTMTYRGDIELRGLDPNSRYYLTDIETGAKLTKDSDADGNIIFNTTFINSVIYHVAKAQKASITGRVYNQEGELLPGATLTMYNAAGQRMFADTASDLDGFYSFPLVPAGSYKITVTFPREYVEPEEGATEPVNLDYFTNVYSITENASVVAQALVKDIIIDLSTVIDRTEMGAAIASAKQELANTAVSSNGLDVSYTVRWVTQAAADALAAAIAAAEDATIDSQEAADSVAAVLKAAIAIFNNAKRFGTKDRLTGGGGTSVVPITAATPTPSPAPALDAEGEPGDGEGEGEGDGDSAASGATPTPAPAPVRTSKMVDITSAYWAFDFIDGLVALGIVDGYPLDNGTFEFRPEDTITRAEMIKLIVASLDLELIYDYDGSEFADWDAVADWAKPYVAAAVEEGIVLGSTLEDGIYILADDNIIRQEMIAMFVRALGIDIAEGAESDLADFDEIDDWAKDYVVFVADEGMINIDAAGNTRPKDDATRAEAAMVLFYLLDYLEL